MKLRIAIQKDGRLSDWSVDLLRQMGLQFDTYKRLLIAPCRNQNVDILFLRDDDIPEYVQDGIVDLGIVGDNVVAERAAKVDRIRPLGFGLCRLQIAVPKGGNIKTAKDLNGMRIATTYPTILSSYLKAEGLQAELVPISGSVEITPSLNVADAICDLVSTGTTLTTHNLVPIATVMESEAALIANPAQCRAPDTGARIRDLVMRLDGVISARSKKYVMLNAPQSATDKIRDVMGGSKSPTIVPLAESGLVAVHAVVAEDEFWEKMEQLKSFGATDILVMNIEKMIV